VLPGETEHTLHAIRTVEDAEIDDRVPRREVKVQVFRRINSMTRVNSERFWQPLGREQRRTHSGPGKNWLSLNR
jgi:hypothetical protein